MSVRKISILLLMSVMVLIAGHPAMGIEVTYTSNSDFAQGLLDELNYGDEGQDTADQLQLNTTQITFNFINVPATGRKVSSTTIDGTLVRIDAESGDIIGEYRTAPQGLKGGPSRTSVDNQGHVWVANRNEAGSINGIPHGSVVKIGIVVGGTRVKKHLSEADERGFITTPFDKGEYLEGPFDYNSCMDRDGDGLIKTSWGLGDIRPWLNVTDGVGGTDDDADNAKVQDADDECILVFQRLPNAGNAQHVSVDGAGNVWVGGYPGLPGFSGRPAMFHKLNGDTGAVMESFDASFPTGIGCGGFGGLVDDSGVLWSADMYQNKLLRYDPKAMTGECLSVDKSWGLAASPDGSIWNSKGKNQFIAKFDPSGALAGEFDTAITTGWQDRGVAITSDKNTGDYQVWVAKSGSQEANEVRRLDSTGALLSVDPILLSDLVTGDIGRGPTGLAADSSGRIWVVNTTTNNVMRIDPAGDEGHGAVDMTVDLGASAFPESHGDMAGEVWLRSQTAALGTWTILTDGGAPGTMWDTITWNNEDQAREPEGTAITVEAQASDSAEDLNDDANYQAVSNGELLALDGQYIKIRVTLEPAGDGTSPILSDLVVRSLEEEKGMVCDVDENESVDLFDILGIFFSLGAKAHEPFDPRDWDSDTRVTLRDAAGCVKLCTKRFCLPAKR